jgi:signal transduction histidine kinase
MELERARQVHSDTLSVISHDIRAPLGVILGAVTELLNPQLGELNDEQRALVQLVRRSSEKLARLANNVMFVNRMESSHIELSRQSTDMRIVVKRAIEAVERSGELGKLAMTSTFPDAPATASIDVERASQALANVFANALRFARKEVRVIVSGDARGAHVIVEDDGPGLSPAAIPALFDRAERANAAGGKPGSGLGLFVVKGIIDAHRGGVEAENIVEAQGSAPKGARFRVTFPREA